MPASTGRSLALALVAAALVPALAAADGYTITMRNGATFRTRYQPQAAPWDAAKILVRTEVGNLISLANADVTSVVSDLENKGFGKVINNTTVMLGEAPNDAPQPGDDSGADQADETSNTPYSIDQFVEPGKTQGLPGNWIGNGSSGGGSSQAPAPKPTPKPAAPPPPESKGQ